MERMSTLTLEKRNDLHLTSSGVGHSIRSAPQSPTSQVKVTRTNPLPPALARQSQDTPSTTADIYHTTTTHCAHGLKPSDPRLAHSTAYKRAAGSWKVNHTLDTIDKLDMKPWRRPLTMAYQSSEMKARYRGQPESISHLLPHSPDPRPATLADHHTNGPTKELVPSGVNRGARGRGFVPQNQAVLDRLQPYLTSSKWFHRSFSSSELRRYPLKDAATYWQCEDYPKAWGHGTREKPLPRQLNRSDPGPMRDRTVFRSSTFIPRLPKSSHPISSGLKSLHSEAFTAPSAEARRALFHRPVSTDLHLHSSAPGGGSSLNAGAAAGNMYKTANMVYGTEPTVVS